MRSAVLLALTSAVGAYAGFTLVDICNNGHDNTGSGCTTVQVPATLSDPDYQIPEPYSGNLALVATNFQNCYALDCNGNRLLGGSLLTAGVQYSVADGTMEDLGSTCKLSCHVTIPDVVTTAVN